MTVDVFEGRSTDPLSLHKYVYAAGDSVNRRDPSGYVATSTLELAQVSAFLSAIANLLLYAVISAVLDKVKTRVDEDRNSELCKKGGGIALYRTMKAEWSGLNPLIEQSRRGLGVKIDPKDSDIFVDENGNVQPFSGGMSVSPYDLTNLPGFKLSERFGGTAKKPDPVWCINSAFVSLTGGLFFNPDVPAGATHGTIQPLRMMSLQRYQDYLSSTQSYWIKVTDQK